jgi:hypothetical protein
MNYIGPWTWRCHCCGKRVYGIRAGTYRGTLLTALRDLLGGGR